jgi:hypothetical protein
MLPVPSSTTPPAGPRDLPLDRWGASPAHELTARDRARVAVLVLGPALVVGLGATVTAGPGWGVATAVAVGLALAAWVGAQDRLALRAARAEPLAADRHPRVHNLAVGVARQLGVAAPELRLLPTTRVNALACRAGFRLVLALSAGLVEGCTRTELEAVIVSLMLRTEGDAIARSRLAAAFGPLAGPWGERDPGADLRAAAVTRYPPAVAAFLRKLDPDAGRYGPFYLAASSDRPTPAERAAEVADL